MYKNFNLTESEREQILNQHKGYGYKKPLNEQSLGNENVEDEKEELSFHMKSGVIANLLEKRGYKKVKEDTKDGNVINIYDYVDGSYTIRVEIFTTKDKILGIVLYRGPEFGYPNTKVEENLIEKIFKREFISLNKGLGNFQDVLDKAKDILESTKKYNNAPSLPKSRMYEGDINEGFGRDISVQMAIWSHLSDIEYDSPEQRKIRCNFIKLLVAKYIPKDVEVNEDKLDALYDQVSNRDFSGSALDEPAMDDMNEGWRDVFGEPDVKDAARSAYKSQGHSMMGKDDEQRVGEYYTVFNGEKFFSNQIEYADYQDMGELPRIENGMLIVPNPAWES